MDDEARNVRQIAALAGVSTATVSRVYRGVGAVSPQMRERVMAAIEQYNYQPSHFGEALARQRHGALGILFPGLSGPYFAELIRGFEDVAVPERLSLHVFGAHDREHAVDELRAMSRRVDGLIVHGGTVTAETIDSIAARTPLVVLGAEPGVGPVAVRTDDSQLGELVRHLLVDHGRRRLAFVGNPEGSPDVTSRWEAFLRVHAEEGVEPPADPIRVGLAQSDGVRATEPVRDGGYDGAVCANDETALGLLVGALGRGISVPDDLAITGVDDVPLSSLVTPGLTTVARPIAELGSTAARLLLERIGGRPAPADTVLECSIVRRGSCGCSEPARVA